MLGIFARRWRVPATITASHPFLSPTLGVTLCSVVGEAAVDRAAHSTLQRAQAHLRFSAVPQFTGANGGPVFTGGSWNSACDQSDPAHGARGAHPRICANSRSSGSPAAAGENRGCDSAAKDVNSVLDRVQEAALAHVVRYFRAKLCKPCADGG